LVGVLVEGLLGCELVEDPRTATSASMLGLPGDDPEVDQKLEVSTDGVDVQSDLLRDLSDGEGTVCLADHLEDRLTPLAACDIVCHGISHSKSFQ
jgi:hypothetical protein